MKEEGYKAAAAYIAQWANYRETGSPMYPTTDEGGIDFQAMREMLCQETDSQAFREGVEDCIADFLKGCMK